MRAGALAAPWATSATAPATPAPPQKNQRRNNGFARAHRRDAAEQIERARERGRRRVDGVEAADPQTGLSPPRRPRGRERGADDPASDALRPRFGLALDPRLHAGTLSNTKSLVTLERFHASRSALPYRVRVDSVNTRLPQGEALRQRQAAATAAEATPRKRPGPQGTPRAAAGRPVGAAGPRQRPGSRGPPRAARSGRALAAVDDDADADEGHRRLGMAGSLDWGLHRGWAGFWPVQYFGGLPLFENGAAACADWNATLDWDASAALSPAALEHVARHGLSRFGCEQQQV